MLSSPAKTHLYGMATHITNQGNWVVVARVAAEVIGAKMEEQQKASGAKDLWVKDGLWWGKVWVEDESDLTTPLERVFLMVADEGVGQATEGMRRRWSVHRLAA